MEFTGCVQGRQCAVINGIFKICGTHLHLSLEKEEDDSIEVNTQQNFTLRILLSQ